MSIIVEGVETQAPVKDRVAHEPITNEIDLESLEADKVYVYDRSFNKVIGPYPSVRQANKAIGLKEEHRTSHYVNRLHLIFSPLLNNHFYYVRNSTLERVIGTSKKVVLTNSMTNETVQYNSIADLGRFLAEQHNVTASIARKRVDNYFSYGIPIRLDDKVYTAKRVK